MEVLIIQKEAFEEMAAKFSRFTERMDAILAKQGGRSMNRWMDNLMRIVKPVERNREDRAV